MSCKTTLRGEIVTIGGERYVVRADNVLVPAAVYFDPQTVTVEAGSVVTYDGQARVVEQVDATGVQLAWPIPYVVCWKGLISIKKHIFQL